MPYRSFKEIKTPLVIFKIKLFKCVDSDSFYIKYKNNPRKRWF